MRGWCPVLIRMLLDDLSLANLGFIKVNRLKCLEEPNLGLQVGDSVLHFIAKSGRRQCGEECAESIDQCSGRRRLHKDGEVWHVLLVAPVRWGDDVNPGAKTPGTTRMEARTKKRFVNGRTCDLIDTTSG